MINNVPACRTRWMALLLFLCFGQTDLDAQQAATDFATAGAVVIEERFSDSSTVHLGDLGTRQMVKAADGQETLLVSVSASGTDPWDVICLSQTNDQALRRGDQIVVELEVRQANSFTPASIDLFGESTTGTKGSTKAISLTPTKQRKVFRRMVVCPDDFAVGEFRLAIHLAEVPQQIELYRVRVEKYPASAPAALLRLDRIDWDGRSLKAEWRSEAHRRIEQIRKQDVAVTVKDLIGDPVSDVQVRIEQTSHQWRFGTFLGHKMLGNSDDARRYRTVVKDRYNFVTLPAYNARWGWLSSTRRNDYLRLARWAHTNQLAARGHLLVYPGSVASPPEWLRLPKATLRQKLAEHIPRAIDAFSPFGVNEWDVTNELGINAQFMEEIGGLQIAADWFKAARRKLPSGKLYLNETEILTSGKKSEKKQATFEKQFHELVSYGAPIDGIGLQGHFGDHLTSPEEVLSILDRMAKLTGKIMITEFDMDNLDRQAQADYLRDFYTVCFSHPAVDGVVVWGFWEGDMWKPNGHQIDQNWREQPSGGAYRRLINRWWTREKGMTDDEGRFTTRVFKGMHQVVVRRGDRVWRTEVAAGDVPAEVTVILD